MKQSLGRHTVQLSATVIDQKSPCSFLAAVAHCYQVPARVLISRGPLWRCLSKMLKFFKNIFGDGNPQEPTADQANTCPDDMCLEDDYEEILCVSPKLNKDDFEFILPLGKGAFGKVVLVRKKDTGKEYAMKVVSKQAVLDHGRVKDLFSERSVLRRAKHPFVCKLDYAFQSEHKLFFVMEYLPGGDLLALLNSMEGQRFDEGTARFYAAEVWMALQYLHDNNIIYRDLKPENVLLDGAGHACLSDFGLSKDFVDCGDQTDLASSFVGSPYYIAPDVLRQRQYGREVDWWSFGVLLFKMVAGAVPFRAKDIGTLFDTILGSALTFERVPWATPCARDLIEQCLRKDARARITGPQIAEHPFFADVKWERVYNKELESPAAHFRRLPRNPLPPALSATAAEEISQSPQVELGQAQQSLFVGFSYGPSPPPSDTWQ